MGRAGILYSHVAKAAATLAAEGKNPTVDAVREALGGTGSKSTIAPMLKRWKAKHTDDMVEAELGVPAELLQAIKGIYDKLQGDVQQQMVAAEAMHKADLQAAADRRDELSAHNHALSESNAVLSTDLKQANDALMHLQLEQQALNVTLATLQSDNSGLQMRLADRATEIAALNHQLTQSRAQFEHYQEAMTRQRAEERHATEQRTARLEHELAVAQKQIAAQQVTIGQQAMQLERLTEEKTALQEEVSTAQQQVIPLRSERDHLSYQLRESTSARRDLQAQADSVQFALSQARMALAGQERETHLLIERLEDTRQKIEKLEQSRLDLLTERAGLQALVANRHQD